MRIPPKKDPGRRAGSAERAPDPERLVPLGAFRKVVVTIESAAGEMIAAPRPWTARALISTPELLAKPQTSEASVNSVRPTEEDAFAPEQVGHPPAEQRGSRRT